MPANNPYDRLLELRDEMIAILDEVSTNKDAPHAAWLIADRWRSLLTIYMRADIETIRRGMDGIGEEDDE